MPVERQRPPRRPEAPTEATPPTAHAQPRPVPEAVPRSVTVIWGPLVKEMDVQGMSVAEATELLRAPFGLPEQATPLVNGSPAHPDQTLCIGDAMEWVKAAGEKG